MMSFSSTALAKYSWPKCLWAKGIPGTGGCQAKTITWISVI
jgi:hypothetical protein